MLGRFIRCSALLGMLVLAVLSWTPGQHMLRTRMLTGAEEHFMAHLLVAMIVAAAVRRPNFIVWILLALVGYAGLLELGQYLVPGRFPALADFAASALGATLGVSSVWLSHIMARRARRRPPGHEHAAGLASLAEPPS
jgi:VanZ family protein